jgi:hypothetical protein
MRNGSTEINLSCMRDARFMRDVDIEGSKARAFIPFHFE